MLEKRGSDRMRLPAVWVNEKNGDFLHSFQASDLSEEGIFLERRMLHSKQDAFSHLSFTLPNGVMLRNVTARIVREVRRGDHVGSAFQFMNLSETARLELKRFFSERQLRGHA